MRHEPTAAEEALWKALRNNALGVKFRRQHAIDAFIVDFYCVPEKLVIEVDGDSHDGMERKDAERDAVLSGLGFRVLHFRNEDVLARLSDVLRAINHCFESSTDSPSPNGRGSPDN
jgi:very-short-patch-repair endonuclease